MNKVAQPLSIDGKSMKFEGCTATGTPPPLAELRERVQNLYLDIGPITNGAKNDALVPSITIAREFPAGEKVLVSTVEADFPPGFLFKKIDNTESAALATLRKEITAAAAEAVRAVEDSTDYYANV